ncbi:clavesin-1 isoform X2 [Cimex lectularius]|uniref:CRAL-TRIO domain-containing protein n=1 Tax=Cimex lectularius TaxID=79782 RepID=A0A8I6RX93_CIMLE|nr:clavesin-1 isoform X2 [Cimex lectularius]
MSTMAEKFCIQDGPPSAETLEIAKNELRETPEVVEEALLKLRELLKGEPSLQFRDDDEVLKIFLRPCKFYPESALQLMKKVSDFKVKHAAVIGSVLPDDEKSAMVDHNVVNVLVDRDQNGRRVLIANLGSLWDTRAINGDQIFKLFYMVHVLAMQEPETLIRGVVVILDFSNMGLKQVAQLTPSFSFRLLSFIQEAMPLRLKQVHIVKQPFIFNAVWKVFQPFVKEKLKTRLYFHGSKMSTLHELMSPEYLPENYGGKLPKIDYTSKDWYPAIKGTEEKIKEWNSWGWKQ